MVFQRVQNDPELVHREKQMKSAIALDLEWDGASILCAATAWIDVGFSPEPLLWAAPTAGGYVPLSSAFLEAFVDTLWQAHVTGVTLVTWGGTASDWKALLTACPSREARLREMALASIDIPLISMAQNGMMQSLVSVARATGMSPRSGCELSSDVPRMWKQGPAAQIEVLRHVQWDAWATCQLYAKLYGAAQVTRPQLTWNTMRSGTRSVRLQRVKVGEEWALPSVKDILDWPPPVSNFPIPPHLHPNELTKWLRTPSEPPVPTEPATEPATEPEPAFTVVRRRRSARINTT